MLMWEFLQVVIHEWTKYPKVEAVEWILKYMGHRLLGIFEARIYSQNGEDGIIETIFQKIGTTNQYFVEFGVEDGGECNTRYLRESGWNGLWMDTNYANEYVKKEFVTPKNIEKRFKKYFVPKEFDLLSIDIDGNDYWVWKAIKKYQPRVVIIEFISKFAVGKNPKWGASLKDIKGLADKKGYKFVCADSRKINAFFVRCDIIYP